MTAEVWWGTVAHTTPGHIMVADDRWPSLPEVGTKVEVRSVYRSPYWSLVEDTELTEHRGPWNSPSGPFTWQPNDTFSIPVYDDQDRRIG